MRERRIRKWLKSERDYRLHHLDAAQTLALNWPRTQNKAAGKQERAAADGITVGEVQTADSCIAIWSECQVELANLLLASDKPFPGCVDVPAKARGNINMVASDPQREGPGVGPGKSLPTGHSLRWWRDEARDCRQRVS